MPDRLDADGEPVLDPVDAKVGAVLARLRRDPKVREWTAEARRRVADGSAYDEAAEQPSVAEIIAEERRRAMSDKVTVTAVVSVANAGAGLDPIVWQALQAELRTFHKRACTYVSAYTPGQTAFSVTYESLDGPGPIILQAESIIRDEAR